MKILHICLACFYIDNYTYQENILPKFHKLLGHEVRILASTESFDKNGNLTYVKPSDYINENGIRVTRLAYRKSISKKIQRKLRRYVGVKKYLEDYQPDFIFVHDMQFLDIKIIAKYAKKHNVKISVDNHSDFSNSARSFFSKNILHKIIYRRCAKIINPYTTVFYGVLPARVDFLKDVYKLPSNKCELLVMGLDDSNINEISSPKNIELTRKKYGIDDKDFLIVFGGKIDAFKTQIFYLIDAVKHLNMPNVKLLIFGTVVPELKDRLEKEIDNKNVFFAGWQNADGANSLLASSNVAIFPGRHSVYWEQATGLGIPLIVKRWPGTEHVNTNNNVMFLDEDNVETIKNAILKILDKKEYERISNNAKLASKNFLYSEIAKKTLSDIEE